MEKAPSLKVNMILNVIKSLMGILFPLITFPYIARVLGTENIGKYNFAQSVVSYFVLLAGLGVSPYAIREGAKFRDDKQRIEKFSSEIYSINLISTLLAYVLLIVIIIAVPKFASYRMLLMVLSLQIICKTIGFEWIYSIYEDFLFVTIRSILFQFLSLILLFVFVNSVEDLNIYAVVVVLAGAGSEILNHFYAKKFCRIKFTRSFRLKEHLKPILILFAMSVAVMVYVNLDITMLGFMCDDYTVGIYSVSVKIYTILKTVSSAALLVFVPRISMYAEQKNTKEVNRIATEAYNTMFTLLLPIAVGVFVLRKEAIYFIAGVQYAEAVPSLSILCISLVFCLLAGYWSQAILIPFRKEKIVLVATIISAVFNAALNFVLIPLGHEKATALTTLLSEVIAFAYCYRFAKKYVTIQSYFSTMGKVIVGCVAIVCIERIINLAKFSILGKTVVVVSLSIITYFVIELLLKNPVVYDGIEILKRKMNKK